MFAFKLIILLLFRYPYCLIRCAAGQHSWSFIFCSFHHLSNCLVFSLIFIYTDDTECLGHTTTLNTTGTDLLQEDLNNLFQWSISIVTIVLGLNFAKFINSKFWSNNTTTTTTTTTYTVDSKSLLLLNV